MFGRKPIKTGRECIHPGVFEHMVVKGICADVHLLKFLGRFQPVYVSQSLLSLVHAVPCATLVVTCNIFEIWVHPAPLRPSPIQKSGCSTCRPFLSQRNRSQGENLAGTCLKYHKHLIQTRRDQISKASQLCDSAHTLPPPGAP